MAHLSGIVKRLGKERNRLQKQLSGLNAALEALRGSTKEPTKSNLAGKYQPKVALVLPLPKEYVGRVKSVADVPKKRATSASARRKIAARLPARQA